MKSIVYERRDITDIPVEAKSGEELTLNDGESRSPSLKVITP